LDQAALHHSIERLNDEIKRRTEVIKILNEDGPLVDQALVGGEILLPAVAEIVGFCLARWKMLYVSMGID
jgi:hypothetical protein